MKKLIIIAAVLSGISAFSQNVGINTTAPAATLDVVGKPSTTSVLDGLIAPRITTAQLSSKTYTAAQNGALVYVTDTATGTAQAINVTAPGYYYFSGSALQWIALASSSTVNSLEPWFNQATGTAATANTQDIYQKGKVSVGANATNGILSLYSTTAGAQDNSLFYAQGLPNTSTLNSAQFLTFIGNLKAGDYTYMSNAGDQALVFDVGNGGSPYLNTGFIIAPHVNGGSGVPYGIKITEQGFTSVNTPNPTETLQVNGTARLKLPANGTVNAIYTTPGGASSLGASIATIPAPTQTFTAANTVVSDANGVLGYVAGLPQMANAANPNNWNITGNAGTTAGTNFIGTTDDKDLVFKRNNLQAGILNSRLQSTGFGVGALSSLTLNYQGGAASNTAIGYNALTANTNGGANTAVGAYALAANQTNYSNTAIGNSTLSSLNGGYWNTAIGALSFQNNITGSSNTGVGMYTGYQNTSSNNTFIGNSSGYTSTIGSGNVGIGQSSLYNLTTGANNIGIGASSDVPSPTSSNQLSIGNSIYGLNINDKNASNDLIGVQTSTPTETFNVGGTARINSLPANGATNAIYTQAGGTASATQNQTFTASRTVVADANGVLGYVAGLPKTSVTLPADNVSTGAVGTPVSLGVSSAYFVPSLISFNPSSSGATGYNFTKDGSGNWVLNFTGPTAGTSVAYDVTWITK